MQTLPPHILGYEPIPKPRCRRGGTEPSVVEDEALDAKLPGSMASSSSSHVLVEVAAPTF